VGAVNRVITMILDFSFWAWSVSHVISLDPNNRPLGKRVILAAEQSRLREVE
jgi:hypothetical protein